jgi:hypothetical protein
VLQPPSTDFCPQMHQNRPQDVTCRACSIFTVGTAISRALNSVFQDEQQLAGDQKWARSILADRVKTDKSARLTAAETDLIQKLVGKAYGGQIIKQIIPLIDPNHKPPEIK